MANASHNDKQNPQQMVIKSIVVNQGTAYRRGMPKARGQTRPYRKFLSHIDVVLGYVEEKEAKKGAKEASPKSQSPVKSAQTKKNTVKASSKKDSSESSVSKS
jgi:hypothetical protein